MSRLLGDGDGDGDANIYEAGEMPARYAFNNDKSKSYISGFRKRTDPTTYTKTDCTVTAASGSACTGGHSNVHNPAFEQW